MNTKVTHKILVSKSNGSLCSRQKKHPVLAFYAFVVCHPSPEEYLVHLGMTKPVSPLYHISVTGAI